MASEPRSSTPSVEDYDSNEEDHPSDLFIDMRNMCVANPERVKDMQPGELIAHLMETCCPQHSASAVSDVNKVQG